LYKELLPLITSARVALLDHPRLKAQLVGLERRTARGGKDSIDHVPGGRDDVANVAAGALTAISGSAPWDGWLSYLKGEVFAGGGPLPASATAEDHARRGATVVTLLEPPPAAAVPAPSGHVRDHLGPELAVANPAPPPNALHNCCHCGHAMIGPTPPACPTCGGAP
jgi:hypothetical protein